MTVNTIVVGFWSVVRRIASAGCLILTLPSNAGAELTFPETPFLRLETGMHTAIVNRIDVDAAERYLVSGSHDKTVRIWDLRDGRLLRTLRVPIGGGNVGKVFAVALSPDGDTVAVGGWMTQGSAEQFYLFDRASGAIKRRITGLPNVVTHLTYSKDGRYLAAAFHGTDGVRVYETKTYTEVAKDSDYGDSSYWADFDDAGRLVTVSFDSDIRLYDARFRLTDRRKAPGGKRPFSVAFSPNGRRVAVGYNDSTRVDVLSGEDLTWANSPDTRSIDNGNLSKIDWSHDGRFLYAGGSYDASVWNPVRQWGEAGHGDFVDFLVATNTVTDLKPLRGDGVAMAAADPIVAVLDVHGGEVWKQRSVKADLRKQRSRFLLSKRGDVVQFGYEYRGKRPARFSVTEGHLRVDPPSDPTLKAASSTGLGITGWESTTSPKLNGARLTLDAYETSRSLAVAPDGQRFLLGADWFLRLFDRTGEQQWRKQAPGVAWAVNISVDGRLAVAAYGDGTIRWYRMTDGKELLALFPHRDGKRWIAWTPEGFYNASDGGEALVGYHLNRRADQSPEFVAGGQLSKIFYRPDLVALSLSDDRNAIQRALAKVGDVRAVLSRGLPPLVALERQDLDGSEFHLRVVITDQGGGIGRAKFRVNGVAVDAVRASSTRLPDRHNVAALEAILDLPPGRNSIEVAVENADGTVRSAPVTADFVVHEASAVRPRLFALAVGVNAYRDSTFRLKYSVADAEAVAKTLGRVAKPLFSDVRIKTLINSEVTVSVIEEQVAAFTQAMRPTDVFVLYLSGHGMAVDGRYHFLPWDLIYENDEVLNKTSLSEERLLALLESVAANKSLVILDTCYAGKFVNAMANGTRIRLASRGASEKAAISRLMKASGRAVLAATTERKWALEGYEGHGVFTYALLQGLKGDADETTGDSNDVTTIDELSAYLRKKVPELSLNKWGIEQFPMRYLSGEPFALAYQQ